VGVGAETVARAPNLDSIAWAPLGLSLEEAARHVGIGTTKFEEMVQQGLMPRPKKIGTRRVWDRVALELAFRNLPDESSESAWTRLRNREPAA
jgi:hypothetical protein